MTIDNSTPKNNFATAPAFPLIQAVAYDFDLERIDGERVRHG